MFFFFHPFCFQSSDVTSMQIVQAVGNAVANVPDPETESARFMAMVSGVFMLIGSILVSISFWVTYVYPLVLVAVAMTTSICMLVHTSSFQSVHNNNCCCSSNGAFSSLKILCIIQIVLAAIVFIVDIYIISILLPYVGLHPIIMTWVIFCFISLFGSLAILVTSIVCIPACSTLHLKVTERMMMNQVATAAMVGGVAMVGGGQMVQQGMVQQTYPVAQPVYGQQQQQGYPQQQQAYPQQGYPQQQQAYPQQQGYPQQQAYPQKTA